MPVFSLRMQVLRAYPTPIRVKGISQRIPISHPVLPPQGTWHSSLLLFMHGFPLDLELRRSRGSVCFRIESLGSRAVLET